MNVRWRLRIAGLVLVWIGVVTALALMDMRPSVTVLAAISIAVASVIWLLLDLGDVAAPVDWRAHSDGGVSTRGADTRVRVLRRQISDPHAMEGRTALHRSLLGIIDDSLHATHGVDRAAEPVRAARLMGPIVTAFTTSPAAGDLLADPSRFNALLDEIERLSSEPRHQEIR